MKKIEVCYSPELIGQFDLQDQCVVVIDILRATSCMVAGLGSGVESITPVATVEECEVLGTQGYVMAGERGGEKLPQFDLGNSPFEYMQAEFRRKKIAATTTNGTQCIELSKPAPEVIIGAFLNLSSIVNYLQEQDRNVLLFCAGWKGRYNLEDSLFAGAVIDGLKKTVSFDSDSAISAFYLYEKMSHDLNYYISRSNHASRLSGFGAMKDLEFCSRKDEFDVLPKLIGAELRV